MSTSNINPEQSVRMHQPDGTIVPTERLKQIRAVVILGGSVRQTNLAKGLQRSVLNLPIENEFSVIDQWTDGLQRLCTLIGRDSLDVRIIVNKQAIMPVVPQISGPIQLSLEEDPADYRGTGGILKDIAGDYDQEDYLLVANGAQILLQPFEQTANELAELEAEVSLVSHGDGIPSGFFLLRVSAFKEIPTAGFHDLKEQCLPTIAKSHVVKVREYDQATGLSIRTLDDYIGALRYYHRKLSGYQGVDPFGEDWRSSFSIVEPGATVSEQAQLVDAVVLRNAKVSGNAVIVRSIVGAGANVPSGRQVIDHLVRGRQNTGGAK